ncbi:DNA polymerase phi-domain-containing protein [Hygrophoropsis aurantiaca]|uniref:DNA polymerase phi-domain-containing protein n=1 Tax=Hygrophoropsis aurantiaca TaxID=72124 RepID=A0ACB8AB94_9AGAM|nr:DNA polymerase phi-domain-containing protein [Hygrophoropsis aurantiaca]
MSTTLPLFWDLSSSSKHNRLDASAKLISSLERFQAQHVPNDFSKSSDEDAPTDGLDFLNAQDMSYSIRRLIRGLASPRESSRLGFGVSLTELLSRLETVTCSQVVSLILDSSTTQGSMSGQEERDVLFARLFGLTAVIQSGLLVRQNPLPTSPSSATHVSSLDSYKDVINHLVLLGEKKSWLRESAWWTIGLAIDALHSSPAPWKEDALRGSIEVLCVNQIVWTQERVAITLKLQSLVPEYNWKKILLPIFREPDLLNYVNFPSLGRILKEATVDEDDSITVGASSWRPQLHFIWDTILETMIPPLDAEKQTRGSFREFFRVVVDESLFASTSSPERKYWGFQVFQKALPRITTDELPMLFTKNFMRSWINHLSNHDRYLHKIALDVAKDIQQFVQKNPAIGFTLILQLTGIHGSQNFDKLTKTKTIESVLASMDAEGIKTYIHYLLDQIDHNDGAEQDDEAIKSRRIWIMEQFTALIRNGSIPKTDDWIQIVLDWYIVNGLFIVRKKSDKSPYLGLRSIRVPPLSEELRQNCRSRLLSSLADLTGQISLVKADDKSHKAAGVASDGKFWVSRALATVEQLETDVKHVTTVVEFDEDGRTLRIKARQTIDKLKKVSGAKRDIASGTGLLISAILLYQYCTTDDNESEVLESCIDAAAKMFPKEKTNKKAKVTASNEDDDSPEPIDIFVDTIIGFLEKSNSYMRNVANQAFSSLSDAVQDSTIDLILSQLERRDPADLAASEFEEIEGRDDEEDSEGDEDEEEEETSDASEESDEDDDEEATLEVRRKIEGALRANGIQAATKDSDDESEEDLMDDDQMMAIDSHLAEIFRSRASEKNGKDVNVQRDATHFKNRVLDLIDIFIKKEPQNALNFRLILPLIEVITKSGSDERQLTDKATGLLKSRLAKSKDVPVATDVEQVTTILQELHQRARKTRSSDHLSTLSQCSLYICRVLLLSHQEEALTRTYRDSLVDFISRKASHLNFTFFQDFFRRYPVPAWRLRKDLIDVSVKAVNTYRQCQAYQLLQTLVNQASGPDIQPKEVVSFMPTLRQSLLDVISSAIHDQITLSPAQLKDLLKLALSAARQTKKLTSKPEEIQKIWRSGAWETLQAELSSSPRFASSNALLAMCRQVESIVQCPNNGTIESSEQVIQPKRKINEVRDKEETSIKKMKRQKQRKSKA